MRPAGPWGGGINAKKGRLKLPPEVNRPIIATGDLCPEHFPGSKHHCHLFRAAELREFLESHGAAILAMSAKAGSPEVSG